MCIPKINLASLFNRLLETECNAMFSCGLSLVFPLKMVHACVDNNKQRNFREDGWHQLPSISPRSTLLHGDGLFEFQPQVPPQGLGALALAPAQCYKRSSVGDHAPIVVCRCFVRESWHLLRKITSTTTDVGRDGLWRMESPRRAHNNRVRVRRLAGRGSARAVLENY